MKKLFGIIILGALSLTACKKDEDKSTQVAGKWLAEEVDIYHNNDLVYSDTLGSIITFNACDINTFCDASIQESATSTPSSLKYKVTENETTLIMDEDGNIATTEDQQEYRIELLTATDLHISTTEDTEITDEDGNNIMVNEKSVLKMKKQ